MNIKSLLLGSAAAMVAVSGAQAADAIVVEPEPVEYVRVCDAYGNGYFYIPGTETCLKFSGLVRNYYTKRSYDADVVAAQTLGDNDTRSTWASRARLNVHAKNETDYGTLTSFFRMNSDSNGTGGTFGAPHALISLSDGTSTIRVGATDSYWASNHGYRGGVVADPEGEGGAYGYTGGTILDYTYSMDSFALTIGVEDITTGGSNNDSFDGQGNFYAGFNYGGEGFTLAFTAAYDDNSVAANRGWAYKTSLKVDLSDAIAGGYIYGSYWWEDLDTYAAGVHTGYTSGAESGWNVSFAADLTDTLQFGATYANLSDTTALGADVDNWAVGLNWTGIAGATVFGTYSNQETTAGNTLNDYDQFTIGITRSF